MQLFPRFQQKYSPAFDASAVPAEAFEFYADKLPNEILQLWRETGWCGFGEGRLWLINPAEYTELLEDWMESTEGIYPFLRTAFGGIVFWDGAESWYLDVLFSGEPCDLPDQVVKVFEEFLCDDGFLDGIARFDLFPKALAKHGRLTSEECYGFVPPLSMGGSGTLDTVQKLDLPVHLAMLSQRES